MTHVASTCLSCGHIGRTGDRFCSGCGARFPAAPEDRTLASRSTVRRWASEGQRKRVTIMFADLSGSTATIENLDPEAALHQLEPAMQIMTRLVQRYEGVVCRRMGDGILALFGAPVAHEDHAVRACFAALGIQQELRDAAMAEMVRIGLSSGDVLYRTISSELGLEIDVVGIAVHIASRMERMAAPGSVYLTGETQALTQGLIETRSIGLRQVKGATAPIDVYEATGASPYRSRWQAMAARDRAPFVGRQAERGELAAALAALAEGRGGVVGISGEAGLGKSRLVRSILSEDRGPAPYRVTMASATTFGGDVPYHALVSALRDLFGISESDDAPRSLEAVAQGLGQIDAGLASDASVLSSLIQLSSATQEWLGMDPRSKREAVRGACVRLVRAMTARAPGVLVFEDLHWIDRDSQYVLEAVGDLARRAPLLVVLTYRPEYDDAWLGGVGGRRLHIAPLSDEEVRHSLREWFVEGPEAEQVIERLVTRVGGNPLFVEECVRALAQQGTLTAISTDAAGSGPHRRYACWQAPESVEMPPSVHDVIASRIDRRSPSCVALLSSLSVVSRRIPLWLVERVSGQPPAATGTTLSEAIAAEILMSVSLSPDIEYDFTHVVLREVARDSLTRARRVEAHRGIFHAIEAHHADRLQDQAEWLAHHAVEGELWEQAALYQALAGERALARGAYAEAIAGIRAALRSYDRCSGSVVATQRAIDHLLRLRRVLAATGVSLEETSPLIGRAEELAQGIGDHVRLGWAWNERSGALWIAGEYREAIATARRCIEIARQAGERRLHASALQRLGVSLHAVGDVVGATEAFSQCCEMLVGDLRFEIIASTFPTFVLAGCYQVATLCDLGRYEEAERRLAEVGDVAAVSRDVASFGSVQIARYILAAARGNAAETVGPMEQLLAGLKQAGVLQVAQYVQLYLGRAKLLVGDPAAAARLLDGTGQVESLTYSYIHRLSRTFHAEALAAQGALGEAGAELDEVMSDVAERGEAGTLVHCWVVRAKIAMAVGDVAAAKTAYEEALRGAAALAMQPVFGICEAGLADIAARQGRTQQRTGLQGSGQ